jgi:hypothetical protein
MRFPPGATEFGTISELATTICTLFFEWLGMEMPAAWVLTASVLSTWIFDFLPTPPTLSIVGDMSRAITLFRLLHAITRHALLLADLTRAALCSSLMILHPTVLLNRGDLPPRMRALLRDSNYRGFRIPGPGSTLLNLVGSRAIYSSGEEAADSWNDSTFRLWLPPADRALPLLSDDELNRIAAELQPKLLMYRLRYSQEVRENRADAPKINCPNSELARNLLACIPQEEDLSKKLVPLLESHVQDGLAQRSLDPNHALVEAIWSPLHQGGAVSVSEVTEKVNAILHSRGETLEYSAEKIGWKLKNLGIYRCKGQKRKELRFSREISQQVHRLTRAFGLNLPGHENCPDCSNAEVLAQSEVM